jgi:AmmeMemoRadiSam system protein B
MKRRAAVAGSFYPGRESALRSAVEEYVVDAPKEKGIAILSPHAGYMYSGMVAGAVYSRIQISDTVVLLGPMHRYAGAEFALFPEGSWETPFGEVKIDETLADSIAANCVGIEKNAEAHVMEHSLEVQVPFLQYFRPDVKIVPVLVGTWKYDSLKAVGEGLAKSIKAFGKAVVIVASSDMSHTDSSNPAKQKKISELDRQALEKLVSLDDKGFHDFVRRNNISMCGFAPATSAVIAAEALGATSGEIIDYRTSYDITGDYSYVVGYGSVIIK